MTFVIWEWGHDDPIVDLHLLKSRNFALANVLMVMLGFILLGSTVLIPELVQQLFGYTATDAGFVISPGGFAVMALMPIIGRLVGVVDVRLMITFGLAVSAAALWHMGGLSLDADYATFAWARVYQASGLAFLFIPINTVAFVGLPRTKTSSASALINLSRNIGGAFGISLVTTELARAGQRHQSYLGAHITPTAPAYREQVESLTHMFLDKGYTMAEALHHAQAVLYQTMLKQAQMLAYPRRLQDARRDLRRADPVRLPAAEAEGRRARGPGALNP